MDKLPGMYNGIEPIVMILNAAFIGAACSIIAICYIKILSQEAILNWWFRIGDKIGHKKINGRLEERWFYKPIWGCVLCCSGQLGLWVYPIMTLRVNLFGDPWHFSDHSVISIHFGKYGLISHLIAICTSVTLTFFINKKIESNE